MDQAAYTLRTIARYSTVTNLALSIRDRIATIELGRPDKLNALSPELLSDLIDTCKAVSADDSVRIVVLRGAGRCFSAGADLPAFEAGFAAGDPASADLGRRASAAVWRLPQITIAAIHGHCVGGAIVLAACCDVRIAADTARFSIPEVDAGIPLAWGGMGHLARLIGETRATDLVLSCRPFDAAEALDAGFLTRVAPEGDFEAMLDDYAASAARKPQKVLRLMKRQLGALRDGSYDPRDDAAALLAARRDPEAQAIGAAYIASRIRKK
jgi:enoyl-CoA hydratase/carnithine racemase